MDVGMPFLLETETIEACCSLAQELGLRFVELNANFPACEVSGLDPVHLHRLAVQYGLYFTLHVEEDLDPFSFNPAVRKAWLGTLRQSLLLATAMELPIVNMHFPKGVYITLPGRRTYLYERYADMLAQSVMDLKEMAGELLTGTKTHLVIENTDGWAAHEQRAIAELLKSPVIGLTLDIGHSHAAGDADEAFFRRFPDKLMHMHGHDARGKSNHLALGDGEIDLRGRFRWADACGARIVLETKTIEALKASVQRMPEFL